MKYVAVSSRPKTVVTQQLPRKKMSQTDLVSDWIIILLSVGLKIPL